MARDARFSGAFRFDNPLSPLELAAVAETLGEDTREHPSWGGAEPLLIGLRMTRDFGGLEWDGSPNCHAMEKIVNVVIDHAQSVNPAFGLDGSLKAVGEDGARWVVHIGPDGRARVKP